MLPNILIHQKKEKTISIHLWQISENRVFKHYLSAWIQCVDGYIRPQFKESLSFNPNRAAS